MISLKIIGSLLDYPDAALWAARDELKSALNTADELNQPGRDQLGAFIQAFLAQPLLDAQEAYCELFDRGRATSLLLFEHVYGESRDRGQAMVDLLGQYRAAGWELASRELPDFLPLYLEYLAALTAEQAGAGLQDIAPILALIGARLRQRENHYAELFDLLLELSGSELRGTSLAHRVAGEARDDTPAALDAVWETEQITFLGQPGCDSAEQVRHQHRFAGAVVAQYINIEQPADNASSVDHARNGVCPRPNDPEGD